MVCFLPILMFGGVGYMNRFGSSMFGLVSRGSLQSCIFTCFKTLLEVYAELSKFMMQKVW